MARSEQDMLKLVDKLFPIPGGEHDLQLRMGLVEALNADNTIDASIGGVLLEDVKTLASAHPYLVVDNSAVFLQWRGTLIALGSIATTGTPETVRTIGARCTTNLTLSTTAAELSGTSLTFTTRYPNATIHISGSADVDALTFTSTAVAIGKLLVDDVEQTGHILWQINNANDRVTAAQTWYVTLASAGSHTIKMTGELTNANVTARMNAQHSAWIGTLIDKP